MAGIIIFIFRRDLRIHDNPALNAAIEYCAASSGRKLMLCFIYDKDQLDPRKNHYYSANAVNFMFESLEDLEGECRARGLGKIHCIPRLPSEYERVFFNFDYTPYARKRDDNILRADHGGQEGEGYLLKDSVWAVKNSSGKPYSVYTPFYNNFGTVPSPLPTSRKEVAVVHSPIVRATLRWMIHRFAPRGVTTVVKGGRDEALRRLVQVRGHFRNYEKTRDEPWDEEGTTRMSPYLKFGCVSMREMWLASNEAIRKELVWREFYACVTFHWPGVLNGQVAGGVNRQMHDKLIRWTGNGSEFARWCAGKTGVPFVDAGMRQLNGTGYMHNRLRMVTASFLVKDLHIDWREGERYFATKLVDYDPASNNGGWQWVAGTGADAQPYFRIFNPWEQGKSHDPDAIYIKRWVPELRTVEARDILRWNEKYREYPRVHYPPPMCDHGVEAKKALELYE